MSGQLLTPVWTALFRLIRRGCRYHIRNPSPVSGPRAVEDSTGAITRPPVQAIVPFILLFCVSISSVAFAGEKGPCKIATKGDSPTAKACTQGGRDAATKLMKDMVKQAKAKGDKFTCNGCHKDLDNYELTKNANDDYKKLEAVVANK
jgi:hypothetical protein